MAVKRNRLHSPARACSLLLAAALLGCAPRDPLERPPQRVTPIELDELPADARFVALGSTGQAYRVVGAPGAVRVAVPRETAAGLLPHTIRLFHFDESRAEWAELAGSRFDAQAGEVVGTHVPPGYLAVFGWSANPAENAVQRLALDARRGFGPQGPAFASLDQLIQEIGTLSPADRIGSIATAIRSHRLCEIPNDHACQTPEHPLGWMCTAGIHPGRCPTNCPERRDCCTCRPIYERLGPSPVTGLFDPLPQPCRSGPCPPCLTCPPPGVDLTLIRPDLARLDYRFLGDLGLSALAEHPALRPSLEALLRHALGDASPQPSLTDSGRP